MLDDESDESYFFRFRHLFFLSRLLLLDFLYFLSSDESDLFNDESNDDWYESSSSGAFSFPFHFDDSVGRISGLGSSILVPT